MVHNKCRTYSIDSYFSAQKKSKSRDIELHDINTENTSFIFTSPSISSSISTFDRNIEAVNADTVLNSLENQQIIDDISQSYNNSPCRPILTNYPSNDDNRSFQDQWYKDRPWLEYSIKSDCVFCYYCRHFGNKTIATRKQNDSFVSSGFRNWKRVLEKGKGFDRHITNACLKK